MKTERRWNQHYSGGEEASQEEDLDQELDIQAEAKRELPAYEGEESTFETARRVSD